MFVFFKITKTETKKTQITQITHLDIRNHYISISLILYCNKGDEEEMKYNVYKMEMEYATTDWFFEAENHNEATRNGFTLVESVNTAREAKKRVKVLYN